MNLPYSLIEAQKLCKEFQHLVGAPFEKNNGMIQAVTVSPFDMGHKQRFFAYYLLYDNDAAKALEEYNGSLYDVIILAGTDDGHLVNESLNAWALKNNILVDTAGNLISQSSANPAFL